MSVDAQQMQKLLQKLQIMQTLNPVTARPEQQQTVFQQALQQYPILRQANLAGTVSLGAGDGYLESWPPGEKGTPDRPRPQDVPIDQPGVQILNEKTRPIDVLGDVVSHYLVKTDPKIAAYYQQFVQSLTPDQKTRLQEQYQYAQKNEQEKRDYAQWEQASGLPAYFRGYAFQQWPSNFNDKAYSAPQREMFDQMMGYLGGRTK